MRMMQRAFRNFKGNFKNYLSLVISLAFTILVFLNFQNIIFSDSFAALGEINRSNADTLVEICSFVLGCFMFFFIGYATNVFLTKRKKEIGTYVFMGLSNQKIARLYFIETCMTGFSALALGILSGGLTSGLFQMILLALSDIAVEIEFKFLLQPVIITAAVYLLMYLFFAVKGYMNIVRSSVLNMISAAKQNEYVGWNTALLLLKSVLGICILGGGFYLAVKEGGQEVVVNALLAVVLVTVGVYLLFGGLLPAVFQGIAGNKKFLYRKERCLWINSVIFRMKKNYRTYAMVCVLALCAVTALATGFALKERYQNIVNFENTYTFQLISKRPDLEEQVRGVLSEQGGTAYSGVCPILQIDPSILDTQFTYGSYGILSYGNLKSLAKDAGIEFDFPVPASDEVLSLEHMMLLSLITDRSQINVSINGKNYRQIAESNAPYLGYLQESTSFYVLNDSEYEKIIPLGTELYIYNYRMQEPGNFAAARDALDVFVSNSEDTFTGRIAIDPNGSKDDWIKVAYSVCIFMFMVFILAGGSILFMKLYNDAFEERERYLIMGKMGLDKEALKKSILCELGTAYALPFLVMAVSSYFSVHALEKMMNASLLGINLLSVLAVLGIFVLCWGMSVWIYQKNAGLNRELQQ